MSKREFESKMTPEFENRLLESIALRNQERLETAGRMWDNLTEREQLLVKEAAVMGFFRGQLAAGGIAREDYPGDRDVVIQVLDNARAYNDLYPTLATLEQP